MSLIDYDNTLTQRRYRILACSLRTWEKASHLSIVQLRNVDTLVTIADLGYKSGVRGLGHSQKTDFCQGHGQQS
jgi:hypothetical protein